LRALFKEIKQHKNIEIHFFHRCIPKRFDQEKELTIYRVVQEALTNVARHAGASQATLQLTLQRRPDGDTLQWQVSDDGAGLGSLQIALQRGNGLAGIRQRVWALGSDLECDPARDGAAPGVCLRARFRLAALAPKQEGMDEFAAT
jgi:two-component system sensor histidine kinase UhpB